LNVNFFLNRININKKYGEFSEFCTDEKSREM